MSINAQGKYTVGLREVDLAFSFPVVGTTVGTTNPDRCPKRLAATTITYAATGVYTLVIPMTFTAGLPYAIILQAQADVAGDVFQVHPVGEATQSGGNLTVVVQCVDYTGAAVAPAVHAGSRINVLLVGSDTGGK